MKKMKKYIVIMLAVCFALLASACTSEEPIFDPQDAIDGENEESSLNGAGGEETDDDESEAQPDSEDGDEEEDPDEDEEEDGEDSDDTDDTDDTDESTNEQTSTLPNGTEDSSDPIEVESKKPTLSEHEWTPFY